MNVVRVISYTEIKKKETNKENNFETAERNKNRQKGMFVVFPWCVGMGALGV